MLFTCHLSLEVNPLAIVLWSMFLLTICFSYNENKVGSHITKIGTFSGGHQPTLNITKPPLITSGQDTATNTCVADTFSGGVNGGFQ